MSQSIDAIVIGSGISGGWAAKELTEQGLNVVLVERGPMVEHGAYPTETVDPWDMPFRGHGDPEVLKRDYPVQQRGRSFNEWTQQFFVNDAENPYQAVKPFSWVRGYQVGGRSLTWGRQCYRFSDLDFSANARDGHGADWPIRYADISPWYDHVERFIGVSGSIEGLSQLPDGQFQPPMAMNIVEHELQKAIAAEYSTRRMIIGRVANLTSELPGRMKCQYRGICARGCSFGAYFSTQSSTLPAAQATGRLTLMTDSLVERLDIDPHTRRINAVRVLNTRSGARATLSARIVFLCAGSVNSVSLLLRSSSDAFPHGLANGNDRVGRFFMDHAIALSAVANVPGFDDHSYFGNRPNGIVIPRYVNATEPEAELARGYSFQGMAYRAQWTRAFRGAGIGSAFKKRFRKSGPWQMLLSAFAECAPVATNRITLDPVATDRHGLPQTRIDFDYSDRERALLRHAEDEAVRMVGLIGGEIVMRSSDPGPGGSAIHEMGGAAMGRDPATSVLNEYNQAHQVPNLFITDGSAMASSACQNPSLTYMALTARAAGTAVSKIKEGQL